MKREISVKSLALSFGISFSLYAFFIGAIATYYGTGRDFVELIGSWYVGYAPTLMGSIIGGVWGFIDGFIGGAITAALYNFFQRKFHKQGRK